MWGRVGCGVSACETMPEVQAASKCSWAGVTAAENAALQQCHFAVIIRKYPPAVTPAVQRSMRLPPLSVTLARSAHRPPPHSAAQSAIVLSTSTALAYA